MSDAPYSEGPLREVPAPAVTGQDVYPTDGGLVRGRAFYGPQGGSGDHYEPQQMRASDSPVGKAANEAWMLYSQQLHTSRDPIAAMASSEDKLKSAVGQADDQFKKAAAEYKAISTDDKVDAAMRQVKMDAIDLQTALDQLDKNDPEKAKRDAMLMMGLAAGLIKDGDPVKSAAEQELKADGLWDAFNRGREDEKNPDVVRAVDALKSLRTAGMDASAAHHFYGTALHQAGRWPEEQKLRENFNALAAMLGSAEPGASNGGVGIYRNVSPMLERDLPYERRGRDAD